MEKLSTVKFHNFSSYNFYIGSFSIRGHLQNLNFKLKNSNVVLDDKMISNKKIINYKVS